MQTSRQYTINDLQALARQHGVNFWQQSMTFERDGWTRQVHVGSASTGWRQSHAEWLSHDGNEWQGHGFDLHAALNRAFR